MKAIQTRYYGATNTRGSRIVATAEGGAKPHRVSIPYPPELSGEAVHAAAAVKLCEKLGWTGILVGGGLPNGDYAFCFQSDTNYKLPAIVRRVA